MCTDSADRPATIQGFEGRGVLVPRGLSARDIMVGARVLEREFEVVPYTSRSMVRAVLLAIASDRGDGETGAPSSGGIESVAQA